MGLFKSRQEREMERKMAIRKARMTLEKLIKTCRKDIESYIQIGREANAIGNKKQVDIARRAVNKSLRQQRVAESQLINIKIAEQMQNQVESHKQFSDAMRAVIKSVAESFKEVNMAGLEKDLAATSSRADLLNEHMEMFLENSADAIIGESFDADANNDGLNTDEFDRLMNETKTSAPEEIEKKIRDKLNEVERALKK